MTQGVLMNNQQWLSVFQDIGKQMRKELPSIITMEGGLIPLGRGAGGDKTFPIDKWAEDIIISALERVHTSGESFTLISEETGIKQFGSGRKRVLVDPIDGSNNAKSGIPFFSTSIALLDGDRLSDLRVGYVYNLAVADEFWAVKGEGAYKNGKRIHASSTEDISSVAFEASSPKTDIPRILPLLQAANRTRCFGSTALDLSYLASGALSLFVTATSSRAFDYAAGMLILLEAGGIMTDLKGNAINAVAAGLERTVPLLACKNGIAHRKALDLLSKR